MIKIIVLDFDGVVVESLDIKTEAFRELFAGYPQHLDDIMAYHLEHNSVSRYIKFEHIVTRILGENYDEGKEKELGAGFSRIVKEKVIECPYVKGAEDFLKYFSVRLPLYVASATPQEELREIVRTRAIDRYFQGVYGTPAKKFDIVRVIVSETGVKPEAAAYIGDSNEDLAVARKTGVFFVGRSNQEPFDDSTIPVYPDLVGVKAHLKGMIGVASGDD